MTLIAFPSPTLTEADEASIVEWALAGGHYLCRRETTEDGLPMLALLNRQNQLRGRVTKRHGVYAIQDARGKVVVESRHLRDILPVLAK